VLVWTERHNVTNERQALEDVLLRLESALQKLNPDVSTRGGETKYIFLSKLEHVNISDLAVYGTLRAIQHLPIYDETIIQRGGPILEWSNRVSDEIRRSNSGDA
jgi:hypothetical protein